MPACEGDFETSVRARARQIIGPEVTDGLAYKAFEELGLHLFITPADKLVRVRDLQYIFVNRRPIDSKTVQQAIYKAYQNARPPSTYPAFLVYMTLPPSSFDVNIHPQKRDVRFEDEHAVFGTLLRCAGQTIFGNARPIEVAVPDKPVSVDLPPEAQPASKQLFTAPSPMEVFAAKTSKPAIEPTAFTLKPTASAQELFPKPAVKLRETEDPVPYTATPAPEDKPEPALVQKELPTHAPQWYQGPYHYIGQLQRSYLLFENPQGLVLIDQHAAQERVLFEHYLDLFEKNAVQVQKLLFPVHVDLPPSNVESLLSWKDWLQKAGFEVEPFSARTVLVKTMPHVVRFKEDDMQAFIVSLADVVGDPAKSTDTLKRNMIAMLACKRAIKAHDAITAPEAEALLENMKKCKDGMHCPHGRPVLAQLDIKQIGKLFGR